MTQQVISYPLVLILLCSTLSLISVSCSKVENLGILSPSRLKDVAGQDSFSTIPLNDEYMLWTFGDTILGTWEKPVSVSTTFEESARFSGMVSNSLAVTHRPDSDNIKKLDFTYHKKNGKVVPFINHYMNENPQKSRIWALDGIRIKNSVYVYYVLIHIGDKKGDEPFSVRGIGLARWDITDTEDIISKINFRRLGLVFKGSVPTFGDAVMLKNSYVYVLGHKKTDTFTVSAYIARVRPEFIADRKKYEFLTSSGTWDRSLSSAVHLFGDVSGEASLSFHEAIHSYVILYCSLSGSINAVTFNTFKELPYCTSKDIYHPPALPEIKNRPFLFYYSGKEIFSTPDSIYAVYINPAVYQPVLLKIPYSYLH